ncbi:MAG: hypothetical protein ACRD2O_18770, partial [Terriglobia bacterium]
MVLVLCCLLVSSGATAADNTFKLCITDTILTLSAGAQSPSVLSLATPMGASWKSQQPQQLIGKVQIDGKWVPVRWKLESLNRSQAGNAVTATYVCIQPHLRLSWKWQARAPSGPLEHTIRIQNLENQAVVLPLQH